MEIQTPTHIVITFPSQGSAELFRASNGMRIAQWKDKTVIYGENPNQATGRVFLDRESAGKFLCEVVPEMDSRKTGIFAGTGDSTDQPPVVEHHDGEGLVIPVEDVVVLPGQSSMRPIRN